MTKPKLLIVEDNESIRTQMKWALAQDYQVLAAGDRTEAMKFVLQENPAVMTLDLGLPPDPDGVQEGFQTLSDVLEKDVLTKVIIITGRTEKEHALKAVEQGAYDFFCKPIEIEELKVVLRRALHVHNLECEQRELRQSSEAEAFEEILGSSKQMQDVFAAIRRVAPTNAPVLIEGESGTGKELAARAIHHLSDRKKAAFIPINCGAIPENLLESELFGHEKGAFSGAHTQRKGRIETAEKGTLFLDEIGELPLPLQVKLLRFLQDQKVVRVGGRQEIPVDCRILAATNSDLKEAIQAGRFREDLYYRLAVVVIEMPPLRNREGDVAFLAKSFLHKFAAENKKMIKGFTSRAQRLLETSPWPGNVRELENRIRRAVIMAEGTKITPQDLEFDANFSAYSTLGLKEAREALEADLVQRALAKHKGNITQAAAELGVSRPTLYEIMDKHGIERK